MCPYRIPVRCRAGRRAVFVAVAVALAGACSSSDGSGTGPTGATGPADTGVPTTSASPTSTTSGADLAAASVALTLVAEVPDAVALATRRGDPWLYVGTQDGKVLAVRDGVTHPVPTLDLGDEVRSGGEQGLLGMTFDPDGRHLFVHYSDRSGDTVVAEYVVSIPGERPAVAATSTARTILTVAQPQPNHNGGALVFGPDGLLYLGLGDGGASGDSGGGHAPEGNGQATDTLLGKILRIDPAPVRGSPYGIPPDNPFATGGGRPEIFATGLRNPWRFSFDRETGDLWIGDVGQDAWEEIDAIAFDDARGANFGWPILEGSQPFREDTAPETVLPVLDISHDDGDCAVVGGHVYRGAAMPDLVGAYVYSDNCNGEIRAIRLAADGTVELARDLGIETNGVTSFGEDGDGELYVLTASAGVFRLTAG
ncbi:MAG TPA: PQQ-dependent sugar dehydrogenase [Acidimicrobiia bacterium]|nr:PQQ-dependent sugar dehydrogenase [Acidimicrobiia bacterium]